VSHNKLNYKISVVSIINQPKGSYQSRCLSIRIQRKAKLYCFLQCTVKSPLTSEYGLRFPLSKVIGILSCLLTSSWCRDYEFVELNLHSSHVIWCLMENTYCAHAFTCTFILTPIPKQWTLNARTLTPCPPVKHCITAHNLQLLTR
jgi:hypothetical protein